MSRYFIPLRPQQFANYYNDLYSSDCYKALILETPSVNISKINKRLQHVDLNRGFLLLLWLQVAV